MEIGAANTPGQIASIRTLFEEYAAWLNVDLCFQGYAKELASLPGLYAPPRGRLLLAVESNTTAGCVALRPLSESVCEMKRLFVRPAFRDAGLGRQLAERIVGEARSIGYSRMRLDTLAHMTPAMRLYESLGFVHCDPYYGTPLANTVFLELKLSH